jgi:hypothetical protein
VVNGLRCSSTLFSFFSFQEFNRWVLEFIGIKYKTGVARSGEDLKPAEGRAFHRERRPWMAFSGASRQDAA